MSYWGKLLGGVAGFAMGGPPGAVMGAMLGHAVDERGPSRGGFFARLAPNGLFGSPLTTARLAAMLGQRDQLFSLGVIVLSAKLAKCDGPVTRNEIDAFKRVFRVSPDQLHEIGRLFDQARDSAESPDSYAVQMGEAFRDQPDRLEDALAGLFGIARADGQPNRRELEFLARVHRGFGLDRGAWDRAVGGVARRGDNEPDAYGVLGTARSASDEELRAAWRRLMRENHPDSLASRGATPEQISRAGERVARINAAWDRVKRERHL